MDMIDALVAHLAENRVVCAYDVSRFNDDSLRFADNLRRFERGDSLLNVVDKEAGY